MINFNVVPRAAFGPAFSRLDAEFVERDQLEVERKIARLGGVEIGSIAQEVASSGAFDGEVRYIAIDSIDTRDGMAFPSVLHADDLPSRARYTIREGDVLVSNVRPNRGAVSYVHACHAGSAASSGFTLLRVKDPSAFCPQVLFALLKTKYFRDQLTRRSRGSMYPAVVAEDVRKISVPSVPATVRSEIRSHLAKAGAAQKEFFEKKRECAVLLDKLLAEIGRPPSPFESTRKVDWTIVHAEDVHALRRIDAEFLRGEYAEFEQRCRGTRAGARKLGELFEIFPGAGLAKSANTTGMYSPIAKQGILTNCGINWSALDSEEGGPSAKAGSKGTVLEGDILLACTAHEIAYIGRKVDVVEGVPEGIRLSCVPDLLILRAKPSVKDPLPIHFVAAYLRHPVGLYQVQRCIRGLRGGHVYQEDLAEHVLLPNLSRPKLEEFSAAESLAVARRDEALKFSAKAIQSAADYIEEQIR